MKQQLTLTQEQTDQAIVKMLDGKTAEIFANLDPDTGRCQVIWKSELPMASMLLLSQIVERLARNGLSYSLIREAVEMGLNRRYWRKG